MSNNFIYVFSQALNYIQFFLSRPLTYVIMYRNKLVGKTCGIKINFQIVHIFPIVHVVHLSMFVFNAKLHQNEKKKEKRREFFVAKFDNLKTDLAKKDY